MRRVRFAVEAGNADVLGDEPVWHAGKGVGWITSGGYGHFVDRALAQGYIPVGLASDLGTGALEIEIIGERRRATILNEPLFDPSGERMRM